MAMCINTIAKSTLSLLGKNVLKQCAVIASRQLYTPNSMAMNGYLKAREYVKSQFINVDELFFNKMKDFVENKEGSMIFTEDLKTMVHLVEKKPEDLELLYKMIKKYHAQNNLRFGSFVFGTVVMRTYYHLDEPDWALKAFKDPELNNFFDQNMTQQILMDLLYNHGRYQDVIDLYDIVRVKNINGIVHPKNPFILVMAACYQQNTKESFDYAVDLFKEAQSRGYEFPRKSITFLAKLALKQNAPEIALEVASLARNVRYIDIRCLKVEAYVALKRTDELMVYFRSSLQEGSTYRKQTYFKDTIEKVEAYIKDENLESSDIAKLLDQLKLHEYVQTTNLEDHITSEIDQVKRDQKPWFRQGGDRQNFQSDRYDNFNSGSDRNERSNFRSNRFDDRSKFASGLRYKI